MLRRLVSRWRRKSQAATTGPVPLDGGIAAFQQYDSGDLYPPHDFGPVMRDHAAQQAIAMFNRGRFAAARESLDACDVGAEGARDCAALLRAHALREELRFEEALGALEIASANGRPPLRARAMQCELLYCLGQFAKAREIFDAITGADNLTARGIALIRGQLAEARGDSDGAISAYRESLAHFPRIALARSNLGYALIRAGSQAEGYAQLRRAAFETGFLPMERGSPVWAGEPLDERPLLLVAEFGQGDMIQYLRYAGVLRSRLTGTPLWLKAPASLHALARNTGWFDRIVGSEHAFDQGFHTPLMQLPSILGIERNSWPLSFPYFLPAPAAVEKFAPLLEPAKHLPLIGLCWAGKAGEIDARRSMNLAKLSPLLQEFSTRACFVSLQLGPAAAQIDELPLSIRPFDPTVELVDFAATLALCTRLDLVISVDTAVAHVAAAADMPVWLLSRPDVSWHWETRGLAGDTPVVGFYPRVRVFRHPAGDLDWTAVVQELRPELEKWLTLRAAAA